MSAFDPTNIPLLKGTQAYLRQQLNRQVPDTILAQSWDRFYRVYNELICRFAAARGLRGADMEECVQEVWTRVSSNLADFKHPETRPGLRAWLYTIVRSRATDIMRRKMREPGRSLNDTDADVEPPPAPDSDPAELAQKQWERAMLETVLTELRTQVSEINFKVLHMRLVGNRDVAEVAQALNLPREQVRYRHHRTLKKLKATLALYTGDTFGGIANKGA